MNKKFAGIAVVLAVTIAAGMSYQSAQAAKEKEKERAASIHQLMEGLVGPTCGALGKALKAEKTDWEEIGLRAALLNEASFCLMADGRCPSGEWAKGAKTVRGCSKVVLAKVEAKDLDGAKSAFKALTGGCGTCHKKHKK